MNFIAQLDKIDEIQKIIDNELLSKQLKYQDDITDRKIRLLMFAQGYLKSSTSGMYNNDVSNYYLNKAIDLLRGGMLK